MTCEEKTNGVSLLLDSAASAYMKRQVPTFSRLLDSKQMMIVSNKNCVSAQNMSINPGPSVGETFVLLATTVWSKVN